MSIIMGLWKIDLVTQTDIFFLCGYKFGWQGNRVDGVDFCKAFYLGPHDIMIKKLQWYKIAH